MFRLLIVDDEPFVVDWIYELFQQQELELDIYKAYSAAEALGLLKRARIDIVLTDISMPDMDGLALLREIQENWPYCRVIFLTAHHEFEYAHIANRSGVAYLLKTESDAVIVREVRRAIEAIQQAAAQETLLAVAQKQRERSLPILQRDYLLDCLQGNLEAAVSQQALDELDIRLTAEEPVLLLMGGIDRWHEPGERGERMRRATALDAFMQQVMSPLVRFASLRIEDGVHVWLLQPQKYQEYGNDAQALQERTMNYVKGSLDTIQEQMARSVGTTCSFVLEEAFCAWEKMPRHFSRLLLRMNYGGMGDNALETVASQDRAEDEDAERYLQALVKVNLCREQIKRLEACLESGQREAFGEGLAQLREQALLAARVYEGLGLEVVQALLLMMLTYVNRTETLKGQPAIHDRMQALMVSYGTRGYEDMFLLIGRMGEQIIDSRDTMQAQR
jgi:two-component system response regulator YesN